MQQIDLEMDKTPLPMVLNVVNTHYNAGKSTYYLPDCPHCGGKPCSNCPLVPSKEITLRQLISNVVKLPEEKHF